MFNNKNEFLPKYLIADNSGRPESIYVVHTEYPRFILNISNDNIFWLENFNKEDENEISTISERLIKEALDFYDSEIKNI
tara:strand:- start:19 stop:258 length:240 start_codon:yes stop_codon:yes gene_type:complete